MSKYSQIDHSHCPSKDSPCGFNGKHRCCLCGKGTQPLDEEVESFLKNNTPKYTENNMMAVLTAYKAELSKKAMEISTCPHCKGSGVLDCDKCESGTHNCGDCGGTGERYNLTREDVLALLEDKKDTC